MKLDFQQLRKNCDPHEFNCKTVKELTPLESIIGQPRAIHALLTGLGIESDGFNIFVSGLPGTGKLTAIKYFLKELAKSKSDPSDWCYVNNFKDPYYPKKISLPKGKGNELKTDIKQLIEESRDALLKAFESEEYEQKRQAIVDSMNQLHQKLFDDIAKLAEQNQLIVNQTSMGFVALPIKDNKPMSDAHFKQLPEQEKNQIRSRQDKIAKELESTLKKTHQIERQTNDLIKQLNHEVALYAINVLIEELEEKYQHIAEVLKFLSDVKTDILDNLTLFLQIKHTKETQSIKSQRKIEEQIQKKYDVNVLVDHTNTEGSPVIIERNPTYNSLFGRIEKESDFGTYITDFTLIREGSMHLANGGFLIIPIEELLRNIFSWDSLKRALRNREISIEDASDRLGFISTKTLKPEPIPLNIKIILYGSEMLYQLLYHYDSDFKELFKIKADFDESMPRTKENTDDYAAFVCKVCENEKLVALDDTALAKIIEYGSRLAEDQTRLSVRFGEISDIICEASFYATKNQKATVSAAEINLAIEEKMYRSNLIQEKILQFIEENTLLIDVDGNKVGQVNGLAVLDVGDLQFAKPTKITCNIGLGKKGIINIERESELSGPIHTKGVMILSGYLMGKFSKHKILNLTATLVFEQSYSEIEGDSASSTELYALLSALADVELRQDIAVTGSVNQKGDIQAIGGVNEKIEGFYEVCKCKGLTGTQGVIIPKSNQKNLMLKESVVDAVKNQRFHIWAIETIEEGIEILTGIPAGIQNVSGDYPENSMFARIESRLEYNMNELKKS